MVINLIRGYVLMAEVKNNYLSWSINNSDGELCQDGVSVDEVATSIREIANGSWDNCAYYDIESTDNNVMRLTAHVMVKLAELMESENANLEVINLEAA